ncbi:MAG: LPS export ABC transporter ATP-binding protein [Rickettsiales bacterium]|nr:LPS export ABC transporter ATP-binding protein [Rickettsiales bacterium]|tara:strand:+ start:532 stop:1251 length:720 start_codon:yes stop_codon:yes gene_type:complete
MIKTNKLVKKYHNRKVVNEVDLEMNQGEVVGLLGPNGAGKTTTFYMITGLVKPDSGSVYLADEDITKMPMYLRSRLGLGYLPQESSIFKKLTVEENIFILWELLKNVKKEDFEKRLDQLLEEMGIKHLKKSKGIELSGGEKRRVEIVRALATEPRFILLDEPFAGIDPIAVNEIQDIIKNLKKKGLGIIISDHNVRETLEIVDRAYLIHKGEVIFTGTSKEIIKNDTAKEFYLGNDFSL